MKANFLISCVIDILYFVGGLAWCVIQIEGKRPVIDTLNKACPPSTQGKLPSMDLTRVFKYTPNVKINIHNNNKTFSYFLNLLFQNYYCCFKSSKQVNLLYRLYIFFNKGKNHWESAFHSNDSSGNFTFLGAVIWKDFKECVCLIFMAQKLSFDYEIHFFLIPNKTQNINNSVFAE